MIGRLTLGILLGLLLSSGARAELQYGIDVSYDELMFMMGQHAAAANLELGRTGPADYMRAAELYRKAAVLGYPLSQNRLGRLYESGLGVTQNFTLAYVWYALAARHGDANALANRDAAARRLDARQIAKAQRLAGQLIGNLPHSR